MSYDQCGKRDTKGAYCGLPAGHTGRCEDSWGRKFVADERVERRQGERRKDQRFCEMDPRSYRDRRAPDNPTRLNQSVAHRGARLAVGESTGVRAGPESPAPGVGAPTGADADDAHMDAYHLTRKVVRAVIEACAKSEGFGSYATPDWDVPESDLIAEWAPRVLAVRVRSWTRLSAGLRRAQPSA